MSSEELVPEQLTKEPLDIPSDRPTFVPILEKEEKEEFEFFLENLRKLNRTIDFDPSDTESESEINETIAKLNLKRCLIRRTEIEDVPKIKKLTRRWSDKLFGKQNIYNLIEKSLLAITLENRHANRFLAFAAFYDCPNSVPNLDPDQLEQWLNTYPNLSMTPLNTVFLNYAACVSRHEVFCIFEMIKAMFTVLIDVIHVILIDSRRGAEDIKLSEVFTHSFSTSENFVVRICDRDDVLPKLRIRPALVEDNDDLVVLFGKQIHDLQNHYGEYFLAELIEQQRDELDYCLVAEAKSREIVGFISISKNVDAELLNRQYELQPFNELRQVWMKPKPPEPPFKPKAKIGLLKRNIEVPLAPPPPPPEPPAPFSVFTIHLFMMTEEHELRYMELIEAAFKFFPEKEFCATSINCWSSGTPFLSKFTRVTPKSNITLRQELYVLHRWGLIKNYSVRNAKSVDIPLVIKFIDKIVVKAKLIDDFIAFCNNKINKDGKKLQAFILECYSQVVGVAIICREENIEFLRANYNLEDFIYFGMYRREDHAQLLHFILNPLFTHLARPFIKEIFRLGNRACLYYKIYSDMKENKVMQSFTAAAEFIPVTDRIKVNSGADKSGLNLPSSRTESLKNDFTLTFISKKYVFETKTVIRAKVVIVGASNTAFAAIKQFLESPFISMLNLYLVTPFALPNEEERGKISDIMIPNDPMSHLTNLRPGFIRMFVRIVTGWMTEIDREKKCIVIDNKFELPYNFLVLCCGKQFQIPRQFAECSRVVKMMTVNNHQDAAEVQNIVLNMLDKKVIGHGSTAKIVVHGSTFEAICFIEGLLQLGVPATNIIFVESGDLNREHCLQNKIFQNVISMSLKKCAVQHLPGYVIDIDKPVKDDAIKMTEISFPGDISLISPENLTIKLKTCVLLVWFSEKDVKRETFLSINNSSLVYDSGLIINHEFRTNDPWIFAAGPMTIFSRRFRTVSDSRLHQISSTKIGKHLAIQMLHIFAPIMRQSSNIHFTTDAADLLHNFSAPIAILGQIPHNLQCFHICQNGDCAGYMLPGQRGAVREIASGNMLSFKQPYIHFFIGDKGRVESITCISEKPINIDLWIKLHGHHKDTLNHLISKYDDDLIPDLEAYFSEPWCAALLHDRFSEFIKEANLIFSGKVELSKDLIDYFKSFSTNKKSLTREIRRKIDDLFLPLGAQKELEDLLLSYLHYNNNLLPMYILPDMFTVPKTKKK